MSNRLSLQKRIRQQLVEYGKKIVQAGFVIGSGGNISARYQDVILLKARNVNMAQATVNDYIAFDLKKGAFLDNPCLPSSEYRMHILCYRQRPDICAVIHVHPVFCVILSSKVKSLKSQEYEYLVNTGGSTMVIPYLQPGSLQLARAVSKVIKQDNAVILKQHGLVCVGRTLEEAYVRCQAIERASLIYILKRKP